MHHCQLRRLNLIVSFWRADREVESGTAKCKVHRDEIKQRRETPTTPQTHHPEYHHTLHVCQSMSLPDLREIQLSNRTGAHRIHQCIML